MAKDMLEGWKPEPEVNVLLPRHTFAEFAVRTDEILFNHVRMFRVVDHPAQTVVTFMPYAGHAQELAKALWHVIEPGETICVGTQSVTKERIAIPDVWLPERRER